MNEGASGRHNGTEKHGPNDLLGCKYVETVIWVMVSRMRLLHHGVELPGIICTADRFRLS